MKLNLCCGNVSIPFMCFWHKTQQRLNNQHLSLTAYSQIAVAELLRLWGCVRDVLTTTSNMAVQGTIYSQIVAGTVYHRMTNRFSSSFQLFI